MIELLILIGLGVFIHMMHRGMQAMIEILEEIRDK